MTIKDSYKEVFSDVSKVLVVLAHPDDMEITCGGLLARLTSDKKRVRLVVITNGGKGMKSKEGLEEDTFGNQRVAEQIQAGNILGIDKSDNFNLNIPDGELENNLENIEKITFHIRQFQPESVITHNPQNGIIDFLGKSAWVNHRDHRHTGIITLDAIYPYSRDRGFFIHHFSKDALTTHSVTKVLLTDSYTTAHVKYFQIDDYLEPKKKALQQHVTAFDPDDADDYMEENHFETGYFEPLGYFKIY